MPLTEIENKHVGRSCWVQHSSVEFETLRSIQDKIQSDAEFTPVTKIHGPGINGGPTLLIRRADIVGVDGPQRKGKKNKSSKERRDRK